MLRTCKHRKKHNFINFVDLNTIKFYRQAFPESTVLPKMHFLEDHVVPWLKKWKIGFGMMGRIHTCLLQLRTYRSIPDPVKRLQHVMQLDLLLKKENLTGKDYPDNSR